MDEKEEQQKARMGEIAKEHMFDKVVTPSDVGKLNRLVIPKQHAEKYFPLDPTSNDKGLLLNFEDVRSAKSWRFRYSYWNSSQSYVMTKGWSRFVKEKKLDAGDIVSFQRGAPETSRDRLFIDWRRRPQYPTSMGFNFNFPPNANAFYTFPQSRDLCNLDYTYHHLYGYGNTVGRCYMGSLEQNPVRVTEPVPNLIFDSVPVVIRRAQPAVVTGKRLRLFGVNMECESSTNNTNYSTEDENDQSAYFESLPRGAMGMHSGEELSEMQTDDRYLKKGKSSSLSFDLDQ